ncbi:helix-turn-helix transcriptional regulator [Microbacterium schleiferi]|uniref:Helix-turn-helix transcriptional regulator n=1 Tax=Microbacterium schleiferi TaxID=69362 RepID=A0A7S8MYM6_9MICO|nr:TetR/AcrR family transcriptional regulator [Microbacterium schleiferi]QPE05068.1 helix-turn-helix transcriptional regulator [Microbacterium schleiferi]
MSSDERRTEILRAAHAVFGARGYEGATTDEVARAAGVSQPYVVRLFGTKESLFLAVLHDALDQLMTGFRATLAAPEHEEPVEQRMGAVYLELLKVRGLHQTLSYAFLLGGIRSSGPRPGTGSCRSGDSFGMRPGSRRIRLKSFSRRACSSTP